MKGSPEYANSDADEPQIQILMTRGQAGKITSTRDSNMLGKTRGRKLWVEHPKSKTLSISCCCAAAFASTLEARHAKQLAAQRKQAAEQLKNQCKQSGTKQSKQCKQQRTQDNRQQNTGKAHRQHTARQASKQQATM